MTHPGPSGNVIYLPAGVAAPQVHPAAPAGPQPPFNKAFFAEVLPALIKSFCEQVGCDTPVVEVTTVDGSRHFVNGISGVSEQWVALQTGNDRHDHPTQVFIPYGTIFRVEVHPESDSKVSGRLGFRAIHESRKPPTLDAQPLIGAGPGEERSEPEPDPEPAEPAGDEAQPPADKE